MSKKVFENDVIILDLGSGYVKAGFSGDEYPIQVFPGIVEVNSSTGQALDTIGYDAARKEGKTGIRRVVHAGHNTASTDVIQSYVKSVIQHALRADASDHPVLILWHALTPSESKDVIASYLLQNLKCPAFHMSSHAVVALAATGRASGVVVDFGYDVVHVTPVLNGKVLFRGAVHIRKGATHITEAIQSALQKRGVKITKSFSDEFVVEKIKEKHAYVALDYEKELADKKSETITYSLPDGTKVGLGTELFQSTEFFFGEEGIPSTIVNTVTENCFVASRRTLFKNIVLVGGSASIRGLATRLTNELSSLLKDKGIKPNVEVARNPYFAVWQGAAALCEEKVFRNTFVTNEQYTNNPHHVDLFYN